MSNKTPLLIVVIVFFLAIVVILRKELCPNIFKCGFSKLFSSRQEYEGVGFDDDDFIERIDRNPVVHSYCFELLKSFPIGMIHGYPPLIMNRLISACEIRWSQLAEPSKIKFSEPEPQNKSLIVLDLDKTILDQESVIITKPTRNSFNYSLIKLYNQNDLRFNRIYINSNRDHLIVYAPYFMEFIQSINKDEKYEVIIYSLAQKWAIIYNAIFIEMYFNFIYSANTTNDRSFRFKKIISRECGPMIKSMHIIQRLMHLNVYSDIILVDDSPDLWNKSLPLALSCHNVVPVICAPKFQLAEHQFRMKAGDLRGVLQGICLGTASDQFFKGFTAFVSNTEQLDSMRLCESNGQQLEWIYMFAQNRNYIL